MRSNRNVLWTTLGVAVVMFVLALAQHVAAGSMSGRATYLTFSHAVRLPSVTLSPGTYVFELLDPGNAAGVVLVRSRDRRTSYYMGLTNATDRPRGLRLDASVSMGESAAGTAPPITVWWPIGTLTGRAFIYPDR
ncbi:MAG: hypothetical protein ACRD2I_07460 [Vicinamibacterales bacterium]